MIDTHAHLDVEEFAADLQEVIAGGGGGRDGHRLPGDLGRFEPVGRRACRPPRQSLRGGRIQPNYTAAAEPGDWDRIVALAGQPRVVAIGETGLDRYWDYAPIDVQQDYFDRHLRLAESSDLPVIIHCREAEADLLPMLRAAAAGARCGVCCTPSAAMRRSPASVSIWAWT